MCEHDYKVIKTTKAAFVKRCFKCGDTIEEKRPDQREKKSWIRKLMGR